MATVGGSLGFLGLLGFSGRRCLGSQCWGLVGGSGFWGIRVDDVIIFLLFLSCFRGLSVKILVWVTLLEARLRESDGFGGHAESFDRLPLLLCM